MLRIVSSNSACANLSISRQSSPLPTWTKSPPQGSPSVNRTRKMSPWVNTRWDDFNLTKCNGDTVVVHEWFKWFEWRSNSNRAHWLPMLNLIPTYYASAPKYYCMVDNGLSCLVDLRSFSFDIIMCRLLHCVVLPSVSCRTQAMMVTWNRQLIMTCIVCWYRVTIQMQ